MTNLRCIALNCTSSSRNNKDLKFHHIPCDPERSKQWLTACKRTDLINQSPRFLKNKFVCGLHFNEYMYRNENLKHSATPSLNLTARFQDSFTQTWESVKFIETSEPTLFKTEWPELKKIEVTSSYTQTEEFIFNANYNLVDKKENDNTDTQFEEHNMQCKKLELKTETKIKEDDTELSDGKTDEMEQKSTDSEQESEDETSEMSIDEFLQLNEGLEEQLRNELNKKNILQPQTPIQNETNSRAIHQGVQTDDVTVYDIPKNNKCFQQCLRCGKNKNRLKPLLKPDQRITLEEFETACERFLSPTFCATVKTQIMLEKLLDKNTDEQTKKKIMSFFGVSLNS